MIYYHSQSPNTGAIVRLTDAGLTVSFNDGTMTDGELYECLMDCEAVLLENGGDMETGFIGGLAAAFGKPVYGYGMDPEQPTFELEGFHAYETLSEALDWLLDAMAQQQETEDEHVDVQQRGDGPGGDSVDVPGPPGDGRAPGDDG